MPELRRSTRVALAAVEPPAKKAKTAPKPTSDSKKAAELQVGDKIPDLTLLDENENEVNLVAAAKKTKYLVIFAYPKASTPGCTRQVCGFQRNYSQLQGLNTTVFGLSADKPKSQLNFVQKQGLKYPLLSDPTKELIGVLGAKKSPSGIKRSHWIFVDGALAIKKIQISPEVSVDSALADIEKLEASSDEKPAEAESAQEEKEEPKEETKEDVKDVSDAKDEKEPEKDEDVKEE